MAKNNNNNNNNDKRGFASMPQEKVERIAKKGGEAPHECRGRGCNEQDNQNQDNQNNE